MGSTHSQEVWLAMIPKVSGTIGVVSSLLLMSEIYRDYKAGLMNPMKRALLGVTCFEICDSFGWWLSNWALPGGIDFAFASGTWASCNFQGFILQLSLGAPMLNAVLAYLFFLQVKGNCTRKDIRSFEWKSYTLASLFSFAAALIFLVLDQYNPYGQICWLNGYPSGCNEASWGGSDTPCDRGINSHLYGIFVYYVVLWASLIFAIAINVKMYYMLEESNETSDAKWIKTQSLLFCCAFVITWLPSTLWSIMMWFNVGGLALGVLTAICEPLQGFWNLIIFARNRPCTIKRLHQYFCLKSCQSQVIKSSELPEEHETSSVANEENNQKRIPVL
jgi:hypothetical protein